MAPICLHLGGGDLFLFDSLVERSETFYANPPKAFIRHIFILFFWLDDFIFCCVHKTYHTHNQQQHKGYEKLKFFTWEMVRCQRLRQLSFILPYPSIYKTYSSSITWVSYRFFHSFLLHRVVWMGWEQQKIHKTSITMAFVWWSYSKNLSNLKFYVSYLNINKIG